MKSYTEIMDLVSDDDLWAKKADLVVSTLHLVSQARKAVETAITQLFSTGSDTAITGFTTSTGRPGRIIIVVGEEAVLDSHKLFGEPE